MIDLDFEFFAGGEEEKYDSSQAGQGGAVKIAKLVGQQIL